MKITREYGAVWYIRDSDLRMAWTGAGKFFVDNTLDRESTGFEVDEETFWRAVAIIDPPLTERAPAELDAKLPQTEF